MEEGSSAEGKKLALRKLRTCLNFITARYKITHLRVQLSEPWFFQHIWEIIVPIPNNITKDTKNL